MKKINWKVRAKNKTFWVAIVSAVAIFITNITGAFGLDYTTQIETGVKIINSVLTLLVSMGIVVDMTTKGIKDSQKALEYNAPRDDSDPNQFLQWESESNKLTPVEYDTREAFSDDVDEVEFYSTLVTGGEHPSTLTIEKDEKVPEYDSNDGLGQRPPYESKEVL
ncbi:phage holin [Staphylococcus pseudintermedius]|uniref:phage holin n=1 Tax=Staphylococcus pseudintermedius TaxID=283734 RepID=UPI0018F47526|nr:phage holin [Staphylococcus pseudintermedius]MBJ8282711.1 phage holin [Staphylococcus pseudintermedius]